MEPQEEAALPCPTEIGKNHNDRHPNTCRLVLVGFEYGFRIGLAYSLDEIHPDHQHVSVARNIRCGLPILHRLA